MQSKGTDANDHCGEWPPVTMFLNAGGCSGFYRRGTIWPSSIKPQDSDQCYKTEPPELSWEIAGTSVVLAFGEDKKKTSILFEGAKKH